MHDGDTGGNHISRNDIDAGNIAVAAGSQCVFLLSLLRKIAGGLENGETCHRFIANRA